MDGVGCRPNTPLPGRDTAVSSREKEPPPLSGRHRSALAGLPPEPISPEPTANPEDDGRDDVSESVSHRPAWKGVSSPASCVSTSRRCVDDALGSVEDDAGRNLPVISVCGRDATAVDGRIADIADTEEASVTSRKLSRSRRLKDVEKADWDDCALPARLCACVHGSELRVLEVGFG